MRRIRLLRICLNDAAHRVHAAGEYDLSGDTVSGTASSDAGDSGYSDECGVQ